MLPPEGSRKNLDLVTMSVPCSIYFINNTL